jgi:folate-binding protein YgfZ
MQPNWQQFLAAQGATFADGRVAEFGQPASELDSATRGTIIADLSHLGLLELSGEDAVTFLQGQVTNDVKQLDGSNSQFAGYCTAKGRLLAIFLAFAHQGHLHLQMDGALKEAILKRLKMYVLRAKVVIVDKTEDIVRLGVAGPAAEAALQARFGVVPAAAHSLIDADTATLLRLPGPAPRFEIFTRPELAADLWNALRPQCTPVGSDAWEWLEITAGIPTVVPATQEAFVPQMLNLDALGGINFKKGCYTGQEIVARTHYLGKVKRRMHLGHLAAAASPKAGDPVFGTDSGEPVGMLARVAPSPEGGHAVLFEVRLESVEAGPVRLSATDGPVISLGALPYPL